MNIQEKLRAWADAAYDFYSKEAYKLFTLSQTLPYSQTTSLLS